VAANIEDILKRLKTLQDSTTDGKVKEMLPEVTKDLRAYAQNQETERNKLLDAVNQLQTAQTSLSSANADQARQIEELKKKLESASSASSATPLSLATSFKGVMDSIQSEARKTPGMATTIKSMDIEVKGLVQVQDKDTVLLLPSLNAPIDANALSTLRVSFGAIPVPDRSGPISSPSEIREAAPPPDPKPAAWPVETLEDVEIMKPLETTKRSPPKRPGPRQ
jgi:hypothetical protein